MDALTANGFALSNGTVVINPAGLVDGRDPSTDGTKLDLIEALADVTDALNVAAAGAVMGSAFAEDRIPFGVTGGGDLEDSADLTWDGSTLGVTGGATNAISVGTGNITGTRGWALDLSGDSVVGTSGEHIYSSADNVTNYVSGNTHQFYIGVSKRLQIGTTSTFTCHVYPSSTLYDFGSAAKQWGEIWGVNMFTSSYLQITESAAPGAGAADTCRFYLVDNGGKSELYAQFQTGGGVLVAAEV